MFARFVLVVLIVAKKRIIKRLRVKVDMQKSCGIKRKYRISLENIHRNCKKDIRNAYQFKRNDTE